MKKIMRTTIAVALLLCLFCSTAFAAATPKEMKTLERMVKQVNRHIEVKVKVAKNTPFDDVDALLREVNSLVNPVFAYAESIGKVVVCDYETHIIDGRVVEIDPLRVVN